MDKGRGQSPSPYSIREMFIIPVTGFPPENVLVLLVFNFMQGKAMASNGFPCTCYLYVVECLANDDSAMTFNHQMPLIGQERVTRRITLIKKIFILCIKSNINFVNVKSNLMLAS